MEENRKTRGKQLEETVQKEMGKEKAHNRGQGTAPVSVHLSSRAAEGG